MSLFPKFKIPSHTPATLATLATFRAKSSRNSESSKPRAAQKTDFQVSSDDDALGVTATDVFRVFGGGRVIAENRPISCGHCEKKSIPEWRRGGKIIRRTRSDGSPVWACHFCGREARVSPKGRKRASRNP